MNRPRDPPFPFAHPIFRVWGVRSATLAPDTMHAVDGGVTSHIEGNTIFEVVFEQSDGMPAKAAMAKVWGKMKKSTTTWESENRRLHDLAVA